MRIVNTFSQAGYKVTLFQTDDRYLLQIEDSISILSWKISKEIDPFVIKDQFLQELISFSEASKKDMVEHIRKAIQKDKSEQLPDII